MGQGRIQIGVRVCVDIDSKEHRIINIHADAEPPVPKELLANLDIRCMTNEAVVEGDLNGSGDRGKHLLLLKLFIKKFALLDDFREICKDDPGDTWENRGIKPS